MIRWQQSPTIASTRDVSTQDSESGYTKNKSVGSSLPVLFITKILYHQIQTSWSPTFSVFPSQIYWSLDHFLLNIFKKHGRMGHKKNPWNIFRPSPWYQAVRGGISVALARWMAAWFWWLWNVIHPWRFWCLYFVQCQERRFRTSKEHRK